MIAHEIELHLHDIHRFFHIDDHHHYLIYSTQFVQVASNQRINANHHESDYFFSEFHAKIVRHVRMYVHSYLPTY